MLDKRGISRAVVLLSIIAVLLIIAIAVPIINGRTQNVAKDMDDLYVQAAKDEAYLKWVLDSRPFTAIYDSENKIFVYTETGMKKVNPYGTSKEHEGKVLYVKVTASGKITTKWVYQDDDIVFK